jgi:hypothetical protein
LKVVDYLKAQHALEEVSKLTGHESAGVRVWAGRYLLHVNKEAALKTLREVAKTKSINAFDAKMVIGEWEKGNLSL